MFAQERRKFRQLFTQQINQDGPDLRLGESALFLAGEEYPFLDTDNYVNQLGQLALQVREAVDDPTDQPMLIDALNRVLFEQMGFTGSTIDSPDPESYYLNRVLDCRTGVAISLSLVYLEIARRIGVKCRGVGLPGYFVVQLDALDLYLDPFHSGQLLSTVDCRHLVQEIAGDHLPWRDEFIAPCSDREILFLLLNNLKTVYMQDGDYSRAADAVQRMLLINPSAHFLNRDLAWCYYNTRNHPIALKHLEMYLRECWPCPDESEMRCQVESIWAAINRSG